MLSKISSMLDAVANSLEKKGLIKEAYEIDKIADYYGRSPKQIIEDNALDFSKEVADQNKELISVPGGTKTPEYAYTLKLAKDLLRRIFHKMNRLRGIDDDTIISAFDLSFEKSKLIDKNLLEFIQKDLGIKWKS